MLPIDELFLLFDVGPVHIGFQKVLEVLDLPLVVVLLVLWLVVGLVLAALVV